MEKHCRIYLPEDLIEQFLPVLNKFANWYNGGYSNVLQHFNLKHGADDLFKLFKFNESGALEVEPDGIIHLYNIQKYRGL